MTIHHQSQQDRIDAGLGFEWDTLSPMVENLLQVPEDATRLRFRRILKNHHGISAFCSITNFWAYGVNQEFLLEISKLENVEHLYLDKVTATDLSPLKHLTKLQTLSVIGATKVSDLTWVPTNPRLRSLAVENSKLIRDLSPLSVLTQLESLALEGSVWTEMRVTSLSPLSTLKKLRFLFLTNLRANDKSLTALSQLRNLKVLQCAKFFGPEQFCLLRRALPEFRCQWLPLEGLNSTSRADG